MLLLLLLLLSRGLLWLLWPGRNVLIMPTRDGDNETKTETKAHHPLGASIEGLSFLRHLLGMPMARDKVHPQPWWTYTFLGAMT